MYKRTGSNGSSDNLDVAFPPEELEELGVWYQAHAQAALASPVAGESPNTYMNRLGEAQADEPTVDQEFADLMKAFEKIDPTSNGGNDLMGPQDSGELKKVVAQKQQNIIMRFLSGIVALFSALANILQGKPKANSMQSEGHVQQQTPSHGFTAPTPSSRSTSPSPVHFTSIPRALSDYAPPGEQMPITKQSPKNK